MNRRPSLALSLAALGTLVCLTSQALGDARSDAKAAMDRGDAALLAHHDDDALDAFTAAYTKFPSARSADGLAKAMETKGRFGEAYALYVAVLEAFGSEPSPAMRLFADRRKKELENTTATLVIDVDQADAQIEIEGIFRGTSPLRPPLRVNVGATHVVIKKSGFLSAEFVPNVMPQTGAKLAVTLVSDAAKRAETESKAALAVTEKSGKASRVWIDGVDRGETPWQGLLRPGQHEVYLKTATSQSEPSRVSVEAKSKRDLVLEVGSTAPAAAAAAATVRISVQDGLGEIAIDGVRVGDGSFSGKLPAGPHKIHIFRTGFEPFDTSFTLRSGEAFTQPVVLTVSKGISTEKEKPIERRLIGAYGGVELIGVPLTSGFGSVFEDHDRCASVIGAKSCDTNSPLGAGLAGYVGYHWEPVGLELFMAAQYDVAIAKTRFETGAPSANPLAAGPPRTEDFTLYRGGVLIAGRARISTQSKGVRLSFAAGPGVAVRYTHLKRDVATDDGRTNHYSSSAEQKTYIAPALNGELQVGWRASDTFAFTVGLLVQAEHAAYSNLAGARSNASSNEYVVATGRNPDPIATPAYQIASGAQWNAGLSFGVMFGP